MRDGGGGSRPADLGGEADGGVEGPLEAVVEVHHLLVGRQAPGGHGDSLGGGGGGEAVGGQTAHCPTAKAGESESESDSGVEATEGT